MENKDNAYQNLYLAKVQENIELKKIIDSYKKKLELCKSLKKEYTYFNKCFFPLQTEYESNYYLLKSLFKTLEDLREIYNKRLLLNPNFPNIKLSLEEKTRIINESRPVLTKFNNIKLPPLKDFYIGEVKNYIFQESERTERKKIVIKNRSKNL